MLRQVARIHLSRQWQLLRNRKLSVGEPGRRRPRFLGRYAICNLAFNLRIALVVLANQSMVRIAFLRVAMPGVGVRRHHQPQQLLRPRNCQNVVRPHRGILFTSHFFSQDMSSGLYSSRQHGDAMRRSRRCGLHKSFQNVLTSTTFLLLAI